MAHTEAGIYIQEGGKDLLIASNCLLDNTCDAIYGLDGTEGRIQGNAFWRNATGVDMAPAANVTVTGNLFTMNDIGVFSDSNGQTARAGSFGPGNVFSRSAEVDFLEGGADHVTTPPAPSDTISCAHCSAAIAPGKNICGGCSKFGPIYAPCYCGKACQRAHWPAHRAECGRAEERARMREAAFQAAADALLASKPCEGGLRARDARLAGGAGPA